MRRARRLRAFILCTAAWLICGQSAWTLARARPARGLPWEMGNASGSVPWNIVVLLTLLTLLPALLLSMTPFVRLLVVFHFLRQALGTQSTPSNRAQQPAFRAVLASANPRPLSPLNSAINNFNLTEGSRVDQSAGNLAPTGNSLDFAIEGTGYFAISTHADTVYTRSGAFQISRTGQLVTAEGDAVLGEQGPITVPAGPVSISPDGTLSVNGAVAGKLRLVEFPEGTMLTPAGKSSYSATAAARSATTTSVRQGMLESSNVNPMMAVVNLISVQRHAEMLQRALSSFHTEMNRIATDELPRVG